MTSARRGLSPNVVTAIAVIGLLGAMAFLMAAVDRQDGQLAQLSTNNDALRSQVKSQGETPVAPPAKTVTGKTGSDGEIGLTGAAGRPPTAGEVQEQVAAYCGVRLDCRGKAGAASILPGPAGPIGPASTVPGVAGADGSDGAPGTTGTVGAAGSPGTPGADGADGAPGAASTTPGPTGEAPVSWTFTDTTDTQHECTRTEPYDPAAPTYSCAAQPTDGETP
jgi:hypothetical protein